jgi:hypothetical protein
MEQKPATRKVVDLNKPSKGQTVMKNKIKQDFNHSKQCKDQKVSQLNNIQDRESLSTMSLSTIKVL